MAELLSHCSPQWGDVVPAEGGGMVAAVQKFIFGPQCTVLVASGQTVIVLTVQTSLLLHVPVLQPR